MEGRGRAAGRKSPATSTTAAFKKVVLTTSPIHKQGSQGSCLPQNCLLKAHDSRFSPVRPAEHNAPLATLPSALACEHSASSPKEASQVCQFPSEAHWYHTENQKRSLSTGRKGWLSPRVRSSRVNSRSNLLKYPPLPVKLPWKPSFNLSFEVEGYT